MANPFQVKFKSSCQSCGDEVYEGEDMYAVHGQFFCRQCAEDNGNVCACGNYKDENYEECYECHEENDGGDTVLDDEDDLDSAGFFGQKD